MLYLQRAIASKSWLETQTMSISLRGMASTPIKITYESQLTPEMDQLRLSCFAGSIKLMTSRDVFDDRSLHVTARVGSETIAAYGRMTPGPNAVFENWTYNKAQIPTGRNVLDLGRCLVNPDYRGLGLFDIICIAALLYAKDKDYKYVVGSYVPGTKVGGNLRELGFEASGEVVLEDEPTEVNVPIQPMVIDLSVKYGLWPAIMQKRRAFLETKGYILE